MHVPARSILAMLIVLLFAGSGATAMDAAVPVPPARPPRQTLTLETKQGYQEVYEGRRIRFSRYPPSRSCTPRAFRSSCGDDGEDFSESAGAFPG